MPLRFNPWSDQRIEDFFASYQNWEQKVKDDYLTLAKKDEYFDVSTQHARDMGDMLRAIPRTQRRRLLSEYRKLIQFDDVVKDNNNFRWLKNRDAVNPGGRLRISKRNIAGPEAHPLAVAMNNMFIQYNKTDNRFGFGSNILSTSSLRNLYNTARNGTGLVDGSRVFVWDTETTGLMTGSGIRQVSGVDATLSGGRLNISGSVNRHFKTAGMQWGYLANKGGAVGRMNQVVEKLLGIGSYFNKHPHDGDAFAKAMMPVLQRIVSADFVAGQNIKFDIDQLFGGITRTREFYNNPALRNLVTSAQEKLSDPTKVIDTLALARQHLPNLKMAKELQWAGEVRTHSLENITLQTNLMKLIREELGGDAPFREMFGGEGGLHSADVDTRLTAYLMHFIQNGKLRAASLGGDKTMNEMRRMVLRSSAFTPTTKITDISHISRDIFDRMLEETQRGADSIRVFGHDIRSMSPDDAYRLLTRKNAPFAKFNITALEQEILTTRSNMPIRTGKMDPEDTVMNMGKWRAYAKPDVTGKGFLNKIHTLFKRGIRPDESEFKALQRSMAEAGIPFAGLSEPERWLTNALAAAGTRDSDVYERLGSLERKIADVGDDLGISRFAAQKTANAFDSGGISLPYQLIREAERDGLLSKPKKTQFGLSAFESDSGNRTVNLMYQLQDQADADNLADWLKAIGPDGSVGGKALRDYGITASNIDRIAEAIQGSGTSYGIAVGYLNSAAGDLGYEALASINQGIMADEAAIPFRAGLFEADDDVIRVGAFRLDRMITDQEDEAYEASKNIARARITELEDAATTRPGFFAAAAVMTDYKKNPTMHKIMGYTDTIMKRMPVIAGITAAAGIAGYINHRRKEQNFFDDTMDIQSFQSANEYRSYRRELGLPEGQRPTRRLDPLATAGITGNLDRNKIGHTSMGPQRHSELFAGVTL